MSWLTVEGRDVSAVEAVSYSSPVSQNKGGEGEGGGETGRESLQLNLRSDSHRRCGILLLMSKS